MKTLFLTTLAIATYLLFSSLMSQASMQNRSKNPFSTEAPVIEVTSKNQTGAAPGISAITKSDGQAMVAVQNVPVSSGSLAEPVALADAPMRIVHPEIDASPAAVQPKRVWNSAAATPVAASAIHDSPELDNFVAAVVNGQASQVVGLFVQDKLAQPVVQQPTGQPNFVALKDGVVTQFAAANSFGTIGLLAHNYLSGRHFFNLNENDAIIIVYGDGREELYRISRVGRYQALQPESPYSNFVDTSDPTQTEITAGVLFTRIYAHPNQVVLQTCIDANGDSSWGRLFITAVKVQ